MLLKNTATSWKRKYKLCIHRRNGGRILGYASNKKLTLRPNYKKIHSKKCNLNH
jgi:hypothetical protein